MKRKPAFLIVAVGAAAVVLAAGSLQAATVVGTANRLVSDLDSGAVDLTDQLGDSLAVNLGPAAADISVQDISFLTKANFTAASGTVASSGIAANNPDTVPTLLGADALAMSSPDGDGTNDVLSPIDFGALDIGFPTIVGQKYRAQVFTYEAISPVRSFDVLIDGALLFDDVTNEFGVEPSATEFRLLQIDFVATNATTSISAAGGAVGDGNPSWAALSLEAVPEPSAAVLYVVCFFLQGLGLIRQR